MIIKPFGEEGISMLQGNMIDVPITDYICNLLKEEGDDIVIKGDFLKEIQNATIQNGKLKSVPHNATVVDIINKIQNEFSKNRKVVEIWAVIMREGDFHMLHNHSSGIPSEHLDYLIANDKPGREAPVISGALYLKVPEMKPPQGNVNFVSNGEVFSWTPKDGDYFVWPSHLVHGVYPFKGSGSRIMISWNSI
tara:strand:+ start:577 stop:1155 length:579 start_codon:yes stop_codon:yes gene_type:complete